MESIDPDAHDRLLASVRRLDGRRRQKKRAAGEDDGTEEVADEVHTKKNRIRRESDTQFVDQANDDLAAANLLSELPSTALASDATIRQTKTTARRQVTLKTPLHRQQQLRVERTVAYKEVRDDMQKWQDIVVNNRVADQLTFPLNNEKQRMPTAAEQYSEKPAFNEFERKSKEILSKSANNLKSTKELTVNEQRILEAIDATESREKISEMRRLRVLMDAKESKMRHWKKVKSKSFHRRQGQQMRKKLLKEFGELQYRDPAAAEEKMEILERDRERATLRHRGTGKWAKALRQASKHNPQLRDMFQSHIRDAKARLDKQFVEEDSDEEGAEESEEGRKEKLREKRERQEEEFERLVEKEAERLIKERFLPKEGEGMARELTEKLAMLRKGTTKETTVDMKEESPVPEDEPKEMVNPVEEVRVEEEQPAITTVTIGDSDESDVDDDAPTEVTSLATIAERQTRLLRLAPEKPIGAQVGDMFDELSAMIEEEIGEKTRRRKEKQRAKNKKYKKRQLVELWKTRTAVKANDEGDVIEEGTEGRRTAEQIDEIIQNPIAADASKPSKKSTKKPKAQKSTEKLIDIAHVLQTSKPMATLTQPTLETGGDVDAEDKQSALIAEAFVDDDVVAEFESSKASLVQAETPQDIDLSLPGWGTWAGSGCETMGKRKRKRFTIKAPTVERRDKFMPGVIISEKEDDAVKKHQARSLPFPYTSVVDYEAQISQPLGQEWMPHQSHTALTQPKVRTVTGKVIRPMHKETALKDKKRKERLAMDGAKK